MKTELTIFLSALLLIVVGVTTFATTTHLRKNAKPATPVEVDRKCLIHGSPLVNGFVGWE